MPEGPEVIISTQYLKSKILNKMVTSLNVMSGRYLRHELIGSRLIKQGHVYRIDSIDSKGKLMWFELVDDSTEDRIYICSTLGMTGRWSFYNDKSARIRLRICCNGSKRYNLYFIDPRNFGDLKIYSDSSDLEKRIDKLAPDILKSNISSSDLTDRMDEFINKFRKNMNIVKILMDQSAIVSGIGNYLVAEILYDAKLSPHRDLDEFTLGEKKQLAESMRYIVKMSYYDNKTGYMKHFDTFMQEHPIQIDKRIFPNYQPDIVINKNDEFEFKVYGQKTDPLGNKVKRDSVIKDRTIHWVPDVQK
jgi:formamidopyrimidine-DNA glycosylase